MSSGELSRKVYVQLLLSISKHRRSGRLELKKGRIVRTLSFIAGKPVHFESSQQDERLTHFILQSGKMTQKSLDWHMKMLEPNEGLDDALSKSGAMETEDINEILKRHCRKGVGFCYKFTDGQWTFTPADNIDANGIDGSLLSGLSINDTLWRGLRKHVSRNDIFAAIKTLPTGSQKRRQALETLFDDFTPIEALEQLDAALMIGANLDELATRAGAVSMDFVSSGDLFKLVWLLYVGGYLLSSPDYKSIEDAILKRIAIEKPSENTKTVGTSRSGRDSSKRDASSREERRRRRRQKAERSESSERTNVNDKLKGEHESRMGKDFYTFLSIEQNVPYKHIDTAAKRLLRKWKIAERNPDMTEQGKTHVKELIQCLKIVHKTLVTPDSRAEYDSRMKQGRAPKAEAIQSGSKQPLKTPIKEKPILEPGLEFIKQGKFKEAVHALNKSRENDPSNPDILAALGWAKWNVKHNVKDAEEYLHLALTFNSRHQKAVEWLAKIAISTKNTSKARKMLKFTLSLDPKASWARKALTNLPEDS